MTMDLKCLILNICISDLTKRSLYKLLLNYIKKQTQTIVRYYKEKACNGEICPPDGYILLQCFRSQDKCFSKRDKYVNAQNREVRKMTLQMWKYQMNEGELQICVKSWSSQ